MASEIELRRAVSALYYGLFHRLTAAGAAVFAAGGKDLQNQSARAFNHGPMRRLCEQYERSRLQPLKPPIGRMLPAGPHPLLVNVAEAFVELQNARIDADYDIGANLTQQRSLDLLDVANHAHRSFSAVEHAPETMVFLTALLLADRWSRSG